MGKLTMKTMKPGFRDLLWILPVSLAAASTLSLLDGGSWWLGLLAYGLLLLCGLWILVRVIRSGGGMRWLFVVVLVSVFLRLALGVSLSLLLPTQGYDTGVYRGGYLFFDASRRDNEAWDLAASDQPLAKAFDQSYGSDQYGGLLFFSSAIYRGLSLDQHRPWLIIVLGSMVAGLGTALAQRIGNVLGGERMARLAAWIMAVYPEALLLGSSQMREPFLIAFVAMVVWGGLLWGGKRRAGLAVGLAGLAFLVLFSPLVALAAAFFVLPWIWIRANWNRYTRWQSAFAVLLVVAAVLSFAVLGRWLLASASWDIQLAEQESGWIERIFEELPQALHLPFMTGYGLTQPLLPAALFDPAPWIIQSISVFRSLGWYLLLPLLVLAFWPVLQERDGQERAAWLWFLLIALSWIVLSSFRAGGDQWDNPRYRTIFLLLHALLAAKAWLWWRDSSSRWPVRVLLIEAVFLGFFSYWYAVRYWGWTAGQVHVFVILGAIVGASVLILVGGLWQDRRSRRSR